MKSKILSIMLAICLLTAFCTFDVAAAETYSYSIETTAAQLTVGSQVDVVISLTNYAQLDSGIRGLQIDVTDIDADMFEVVSHKSLVTDASASSNITSDTSNGIRYMFIKTSGTMDKSVTDVMTFTLKLKQDIPEGTSVSIPVKLKFGTTSGNVTVTDSIVITGKAQTPEEIVSLDVSWGSMEFVYNDGTWDKDNHKWVGTGWEPASEDSNKITVTNNGTSDVKVMMSFSANNDFPDVYGKFVDENQKKLTTGVDVSADKTAYEFWFVLYGQTDSRWTDEYKPLGEITLSIVE